MAIKVSVVVPVFNPGHHIDDCLDSVVGQSLPKDDYEAIFVDDGSTDGTGDRLDAFAAEHANVSIIHIENSGWPGRPRNVGIDAARGEFVYFIDNDDWIADGALERLYDRAVGNGADIVIGKVVGHGRRISRDLFAQNWDDATLRTAPLLRILTPHKLFRKAFLDQHGIRFPEGRRRLEDHVFVLTAYFRAQRISVLSDYPCYHWVRRDDDSNASHGGFDPVGYFKDVREVLDIVEANTEPGDFRDRLLRHWYQSKMLSRMGGRRFLSYPDDFRRTLYEEIRKLAFERFGPGVVQGLSSSLRVRARLIHDDRLDLLTRLADVESTIRMETVLDPLTWSDRGLGVSVTARLVYEDGSPVRFRVDDGRVFWRLPPSLDGDEAVPAEDLDVTEEIERSTFQILLRRRSDLAEFSVTGSVMGSALTEVAASGGDVTPVITASALVDAEVAAAGTALPPGTWDVRARMTICGWDVVTRLRTERTDAVAVAPPPALVGERARVISPFGTKLGNLSVEVGGSLGAALKRCPTLPDDGFVEVSDGETQVTLDLPLVHLSHSGETPELLLKGSGASSTSARLPAEVVACAPSQPARLTCRLSPAGTHGPPPGSWRLAASVDGHEVSLRWLLDVTASGRVTIRRPGATRAPRPRWRRVVARLRVAGRRLAR